jgi:hypothetical protein
VDVNQWPSWDTELESTKLDTAFAPGARFKLRPKGGPNVSIELISVEPLVQFTDVTKFPLARMYDQHALEDTPEGLKIKNKIWVKGPLGWLWRRLVAQGVANGVPAQTDAVAAYAARSHSGKARTPGRTQK